MTHHHAVVWLDHQKARVFHFGAEGSETTTVAASGPNHLVHKQHHQHQAGFRDGRRTPVDYGYYEAVIAALGDAKEWLVMGPGGYRFGDYWKVGLPLTAVVILTAVPLIVWVWPL